LNNGKNSSTGVEVEIFGQKYVIKGNDNEAYILQLAEYVDSKMLEMHGRLHLSTPTKVAVLAAINIAHEMFAIKKEMEEKESVIAEKTEKLLDILSVEFKT
jgi:cell division protein ZapA